MRGGEIRKRNAKRQMRVVDQGNRETGLENGRIHDQNKNISSEPNIKSRENPKNQREMCKKG